MMAFRRPKSLRDYLVRAKLRPLDQKTEDTEEPISVQVTDVMFVIILL